MGFFQGIATILENYWLNFLEGMGYTLVVSIISTILGLVIGLIVGIVRTIPESKNPFVKGVQKVVNFILAAYIEIFRGTPMMAQAMVIYWAFADLYPEHALLPWFINLFAIIIVTINTGAYISEIVRGGILAIDKGQFEGATAIGMTHFQTMVHIVIPQVMKTILPSISNEFVINIKDTSVLNVIGFTELYFFTKMSLKTSAKVFESYFICCVLYFIMTFIITRILRWVEKLIAGKDTYTICGSQTDPKAEIRIKNNGGI